MQKATAQQVKEHNRRLITRAIWRRENVSRANLARLTGLTRPTVSEIVSSLIAKGLVREDGPGKSTGGKRPRRLAFVVTAYQAIAVDLGGSSISGAIVDLRGNILERVTLPTDRSSGEGVLQVLYSTLDLLLERTTAPILGVGIATPGLVSPDTGVVRVAVNLKWHDVPLMKLLEERYRLPVYVANDTNAAALGEKVMGAGENSSDMIVIMVGTGIGAGIIIDGKIYHGAAGAGEIGHIPIVNEGELCACGRRGCLETLASGPAIARRAKAAAREHPESLLNSLVGSDHAINGEIVHRAAQANDPLAQALIKETGYYLGIAVAALVNTLSPKRIVIGGGVSELGQLLFDSIRCTVAQRALPLLAQATEIVPASLGPDVGLLGAAALVLAGELGVV